MLHFDDLLCMFPFQEAIRYYDPIVKKQADSILEVPAIVLANLCVSHIMISQNEEAEELMRKASTSTRGFDGGIGRRVFV